ncbi:hypothetical protein B0J12DRAFT_731978 [Macrophomina phaseolina]|uniref:Rhodopsin domain-containing protein n=1 Tax=Macrophomina phaseolina TaxID=35725 RepID=A0ABQ8G0H8_9PEZI|nr:hypothetical protein B0J12DRAFT_731978 [Macrophomina phaseolina]
MSTTSYIPAASAPLGQESNLVNSPSVGYQITICNAICAVFIGLVVGLKIYTECHITRSVGCDDFFAFLSAALWACNCVVMQVSINYGLGRHIWNVAISDFSPRFMRLWFIYALIYTGVMFSAKLSILLFYRSLFALNISIPRWTVVIVFVVGDSVLRFIVHVLQCIPVSAYWDFTITNAHCIDRGSYYVSIAVLNVVGDVLILSLPLPILWRLRIGRFQKIKISIIFILGSSTCLVSILRIRPILLYKRQGTNDLTFYLVELGIWTQVETAIGVICACVIKLGPLLKHCSKFFFRIWNINDRDGIAPRGLYYLGSLPLEQYSQDITQHLNREDLELSISDSS